MIEAIGYLAAILGILGFLPQVIKTVRTRKTRDISLASMAILSVGSTLWVIYGIGTMTKPIILTNTVITICAYILLAMKLRYK